MHKDTTLPPDRHLVAAMMRGDAAALDSLYQRHGTTVYALAYGMLVDSTDAEEVVAETFAYVWEAAARWVGTANQSVSGWLRDVARSRARGLLLAREWPGRLGSMQGQRSYVLREEMQ